MKTTFNFKHLEPLESITTYAQTRVEKMEKYALHKEENIHFIFSVQNKHEHIAEVILNAGPVHFTAHAKDENLYAAIDSVVDKLERQLTKHKEKVQDHHIKEHHPKRPAHEADALAEEVLEVEEE
jgi:putative sigma-54 modulation protein